MNLKNLNDEVDILIVGGGIVGCGILRDLALNQEANQSKLKILMVEKGDFNSQTSQGSSKMLHGGIRYLENFDFSLVSEALQEKNLWLKLTPHLCYEDSFHLPVYKSSKYPLFMVGIGMLTYDLLSRFQNSPSRIMGKKKILSKVPQLNPRNLKGAGIYYDAVVDDAKLGLECLYDALVTPKVEAMNYTELVEFKRQEDICHGVLKDAITGETKTIKAKQVIFATGPFTDHLFKQLNFPWQPKLLPNKGIHLWLKRDAINLNTPIVLQTKDNRIIFVIPQRDAILAGTTEKKVKGDFFNIQVEQDEVDYLLSTLQSYFPAANLNESHIIDSFAAVRPLVKEGSGVDLSKVSRVHKTFHPYPNVDVIIGGKYTTFRVMAQDLTRLVMRKLDLPYHDNLTMNPLRVKSIVNTFNDEEITQADIDNIIKKEHVKSIEDLMQRRLGVINQKRLKFNPDSINLPTIT
jgi:glycerol-3-phosphate dehydrogenase